MDFEILKRGGTQEFRASTKLLPKVGFLNLTLVGASRPLNICFGRYKILSRLRGPNVTQVAT